jgi:hypothetical protein
MDSPKWNLRSTYENILDTIFPIIIEKTLTIKYFINSQGNREMHSCSHKAEGKELNTRLLSPVG